MIPIRGWCSQMLPSWPGQNFFLDSYPMMSYGQTKQRRQMHTIKITVEAGCVVEVDGLPDGFDYEIIDKDTQQEEKEE
jgi:hypothetical protein